MSTNAIHQRAWRDRQRARGQQQILFHVPGAVVARLTQLADTWHLPKTRIAAEAFVYGLERLRTPTLTQAQEQYRRERTPPRSRAAES